MQKASLVLAATTVHGKIAKQSVTLAGVTATRVTFAPDALGLSLEATKIRLHRARGRLRALLEGHCELYRDPVTGIGCDRKE